MKDLGAVLLAAKEILNIQLTMGEFTFSFWGILLWLIVATAVVWMILKWMKYGLFQPVAPI